MIRKYRIFTAVFALALTPFVWADTPVVSDPASEPLSSKKGKVVHDSAKPAWSPTQHTKHNKPSTIYKLNLVASAQADERGDNKVQLNTPSIDSGRDSVVLWIVGTLLMSLLLMPRERRHIRREH